MEGDDLEGDWASAPVPRTAASPTITMVKTGRLEGLHKDLHLTEAEQPLAIPFTRKPIRLTQVTHSADSSSLALLD